MTQTVRSDSLGQVLHGTDDRLNRLERTEYVPVGVVLPYGGYNAPPGFLLCDGTAYSRTTYSNLFGVIGTNFGKGDGSTTFNIPDLRGRFPVGYLAGVIGEFIATAIGTTGGEAVHILTTAEMPTHNHSETAPHYHVTQGYPTNPYFLTSAGEYVHFTTGRQNTGDYQGSAVTSGGPGTGAYSYVAPSDNPAGTATTGLTTITGGQSAITTVSNTGGGQGHNNVPPFLTLNFIISSGIRTG